MAVNQPSAYADMPIGHNYVRLYEKLPSIAYEPQMNSTLTHLSACVFGRR